MPTYCILGSGRLARHLKRYFDYLQIPYTQWSRQESSPDPTAIVQASHLLLAVSDSAIEELARENSQKICIHFSGALQTPFAHSVHPLMTFGEALYDLNTYTQIPFVTDRGAPQFKDLFPALPNPSYEIEPKQKPLYHALCVMSGNFTTLLWSRAFEAFQADLGLPPEILLPYFKQLTLNLSSSPKTPKNHWSGPLVRGDTQTMEKNISSLPLETDREIYRAFVTAFKKANPKVKPERQL